MHERESKSLGRRSPAYRPSRQCVGDQHAAELSDIPRECLLDLGARHELDVIDIRAAGMMIAKSCQP